MIIPNLAALLPLSLPHLFSAPSTENIAQTPPLPSGARTDRAAGRVESPSKATIVIPRHQPAFAERIDPHLVAFSIEADRWPDWAGDKVGQANGFTKQALRNLEERSGVPPAIRVGGASVSPSCLCAGPEGHRESLPALWCWDGRWSGDSARR